MGAAHTLTASNTAPGRAGTLRPGRVWGVSPRVVLIALGVAQSHRAHRAYLLPSRPQVQVDG